MPRYWLFKTEPSSFSIDDLAARPGSEAWDGVRNYQARNLLRDEVRVGDGVLIYHSNIAQPVIAGIARVSRAGYPDASACDPQSRYFDPRASAADPRWYRVDVAFVARLPVPLTREVLRQHPLLCNMALLHRGNRLSIQPVTGAEWQEILALAGLAGKL